MSFTSGGAIGAQPRWRDVHVAAAARGTSYGGDALAVTALLLALQARGGGGYAVAALMIASSVPLVVLSPLAGRLVDRVDSRVLLVSVGLGQAACCALMAYAQTPAALVGLSALLSAGLAITQPTFSALLPAMVGREHLPRAVATGQTAVSIGMLAGPALAGVLIGRYGLRLPLLLDAATYLAITVAGLLVRTRRNGPLSPHAAAGPAPAWRLRTDRLLTAGVVQVTAVLAATGLVHVVEVFLIRGVLHASTTVYGLLEFVWVGTAIVGAWLVARRPFGDGALALLTGALLGTICLTEVVAAGAPSVGWLVVPWVVGGLANGGVNAAISVLLGRRVPPEQRGRANARVGASVNGAALVGYGLAGVLLGSLSPRTLFAGAGIAGLLVVAAFLAPVWRAVRAERAAVAAPTPAAPEPIGV